MFTLTLRSRPVLLSVAAALSFTLGGCGGGGGGHVASIPPPAPPPPPPPPPQGVAIFGDPQPGTYATVGASAAGLGGYVKSEDPIGPISTASGDQPHIRYTTDGHYEVLLPGAGWEQLVPYGQGTSPDVLTVASSPTTQLVVSRLDNYQYSALSTWSSPEDRYGTFAFGVPTPEGAVPVTGSANYLGGVIGQSDVYLFDYLAGASFRVGVDGTVSLDFDFAKGSLDGWMSLTLQDWTDPLVLGTFDFKDTVYSVGSTSYSGKFDTTASGENWFLGQFTGPTAQETIGAWALPFKFTTGTDTLPADNQSHQAFGAWVAQRGP